MWQIRSCNASGPGVGCAGSAPNAKSQTIKWVGACFVRTHIYLIDIHLPKHKLEHYSPET